MIRDEIIIKKEIIGNNIYKMSIKENIKYSTIQYRIFKEGKSGYTSNIYIEVFNIDRKNKKERKKIKKKIISKFYKLITDIKEGDYYNENLYTL